jgi:hypothetical protein
LINLEGKVLNNATDILQFNKFIEKKDIDLMLINRFVGTSLFEVKSVPIKFIPELNGIANVEDQKDLLQKCKVELAKMFFDKNQAKNIWKLLLKIVDLVNQNANDMPSQIYTRIPPNVLNSVSGLSDKSVKFFIAKVQEGIS